MPPQFGKALDVASQCLDEYRLAPNEEERQVILDYISINLMEHGLLVIGLSLIHISEPTRPY